MGRSFQQTSSIKTLTRWKRPLTAFRQVLLVLLVLLVQLVLTQPYPGLRVLLVQLVLLVLLVPLELRLG